MTDFSYISTPVHGMQWFRERRRLLNGGGDIRYLKTRDGIVRTAWNFPADCVLKAVNEHQSLAAAGVFVKEDVKRRITRISIAGKTLIVKEYMRPRRFYCFSPDSKGWLGSQRLPFAAHCLGWFRKHDASRAWLVLEDAGNDDLFKPDVSSDEAVALTLTRFRFVAGLLAAMHRNGIFHADTKPGNFVTRGTEGNARLIDCDDVRVYSRIPMKRRLKNLAQFIGCLWNITDFGIRSRLTKDFLETYAACAELAENSLENYRPEMMAFLDKLYPDQHDIMEKILCSQ